MRFLKTAILISVISCLVLGQNQGSFGQGKQGNQGFYSNFGQGQQSNQNGQGFNPQGSQANSYGQSSFGNNQGSQTSNGQESSGQGQQSNQGSNYQGNQANSYGQGSFGNNQGSYSNYGQESSSQGQQSNQNGQGSNSQGNQMNSGNNQGSFSNSGQQSNQGSGSQRNQRFNQFSQNQQGSFSQSNGQNGQTGAQNQGSSGNGRFDQNNFGGGQGSNFGQQAGNQGYGFSMESQIAEPTFLNNVTSDARNTYFGIVNNRNLTTNQISEQTKQWAKENGVEEQFEEFETSRNSVHTQAIQNVSSVINNLAVVQAAIEAIFSNKSSTATERQLGFEQLQQQYPMEYSVISNLQNMNEQHEFSKMRNGRQESAFEELSTTTVATTRNKNKKNIS